MVTISANETLQIVADLRVHVGQSNRHDVVVRHLDELRTGDRVLLLARVRQRHQAALVQAVSLMTVGGKVHF